MKGEWKSSDKAVLGGWLFHATLYASPEHGEVPIPSTWGFYPSWPLKAIAQFDGTESKSHQSSFPQLQVLTELGCFSANPFTECDS